MQGRTARGILGSFSLILFTCSVAAASEGEPQGLVRTFLIIRPRPKAEVCFKELVSILCQEIWKRRCTVTERRFQPLEGAERRDKELYLNLMVRHGSPPQMLKGSNDPLGSWQGREMSTSFWNEQTYEH